MSTTFTCRNKNLVLTELSIDVSARNMTVFFLTQRKSPFTVLLHDYYSYLGIKKRHLYMHKYI